MATRDPQMRLCWRLSLSISINKQNIPGDLAHCRTLQLQHFSDLAAGTCLWSRWGQTSLQSLLARQVRVEAISPCPHPPCWECHWVPLCPSTVTVLVFISPHWTADLLPAHLSPNWLPESWQAGGQAERAGPAAGERWDRTRVRVGTAGTEWGEKLTHFNRFLPSTGQSVQPGLV